MAQSEDTNCQNDAIDKAAHPQLPNPLAEAHVANTFPQGCQLSPDSLCVLTSQGQDLLLYNTEFNGCNEEWKPVLKCAGGDSIRSYAWYPHMDSSNPATCCFLAAARDQPAHLYDAYTGAVRASYRPYNALDEMESPSTVCFANQGSQVVLGGFRTDRMLHVFDLNRPGRDPTIVLKLGKTRRSKDGQKGIVSALSASSENLLAVGTYSPGSIYLYDLRAQSSPVSEINISGTCVVGHGKSHSRKRKHFVEPDSEEDTLNFSAAKIQWYQSRAQLGVTQVDFVGENQYLFSSSRRSNAVLQWDLRSISSSNFCPGIASYETHNGTNQRLEYEVEGEHLYVGGEDDKVRVYNYRRGDTSCSIFGGAKDTVNGVSVVSLPSSGRTMLATATGTRKFPSDGDWDSEEPLLSSEVLTTGNLTLYDMSSLIKNLK